GLRRLVRLVEERVFRCTARARLAPALLEARRGTGSILFVALLAPGAAAVVDAATRALVLELQRLDLDLALEEFLEVSHQPVVTRRHQRHGQAGGAGAAGAA